MASSAAVSVCLVRRIRRRVAVSGAVVGVGCSAMLTSALGRWMMFGDMQLYPE